MPRLSTLPPFAAWAGPKDARIVLLGEAWGRGEDEVRQPFSHESGKELWLMLGEAWPDIDPGEHQRLVDLHRWGLGWIRQRGGWMQSAGVGMTNVLNFRPPNNKIPDICSSRKELPADYPPLPALRKGLYLQPQYLPELERLEAELLSCSPNLVVAMGNTACWALLRATNISQIRGTTTAGSLGKWEGKVLPTYHPASLLYEGVWKWRVIIVSDLIKALREAQSSDISRPARQILISPTMEEVRAWHHQTMTAPPPLLSCDTETSLGMIDTIGFSSRADSGFVCQVGPHRVRRGAGYETIWPQRNGQKRASYWDFEEEVLFWTLVREVLESPVPKVGQNFLYDLQYLLRMGISPRACLEDTMLLHHALFPEMQKGLGFLGSIYSNEPAWKLMHRQADSEKRDE